MNQEKDVQRKRETIVYSSDSHVSNKTITKNDNVNMSNDSKMLENLRKGSDIPQSDIRKVMSEMDERRECNVTKYIVTSACMKTKTGALVDRGANGGLVGDDVLSEITLILCYFPSHAVKLYTDRA